MNISKDNNINKYKLIDIFFYSNPKNINFYNDLTKDSYSYHLDNSFIVFKSIEDILCLIYSNKKNFLISFNLVDCKKIIEIKNTTEEIISGFKHYLDIINKRDLILSLSCLENNIKIWNANNWECLLNIKKLNNLGRLYSSCFLNDNNQLYILTSNYNIADCEQIKVFDFNGNKIKEIDDSNYSTFFIDTYYDNKLLKNYIITGNKGNTKSYDYIKNTIYHKYDDNENDYRSHNNIIIFNKNQIVKLIELSNDEKIRIWNFHSGELINKIEINNNSLYSICLWNEENIFVGCKDGNIKLIDINNGNVIKDYIEHKKHVITIKKIIHPKYGECILSQGAYDEQIKLWINTK